MSSSLFEFFKGSGSVSAQVQNKIRVQRINPKQVKERQLSDPEMVLLDVRMPEEYREGHIPGSRLLPLPVLPSRANELPADKSTPLVVYCRSGARSAQAANKLVQMGYEQVFDMGGIISWPYEITRG